MPRVLFVANDPPGHAVTRYRCDNPAALLRAAGWTAEVAYVGQARVRVEHDVVVLHRICRNADGRQWAAAARACGAALVYSTDDLVFDAETLAADPQVPARYVRFAPLHAAMMAEVDALLLSTEFLRRRAAELFPDKPAGVLRNFVSPELLHISGEAAVASAEARARRRAEGRIVFGYLSGSASHDGDLATVAGPIREVFAACPGAELLLVGPVALPVALEAVADRVRRHPFVPWRELPGLLAEVDVNLAPLDAARAFNRAKSELKQWEAAAVGVPTVATRTAGFAEVSETGGAMLVSDAREWREALATLAADAQAREHWTARARAALVAGGVADAWAEPAAPLFRRFLELRRAGTGLERRPRVVNWPFSPKHWFKAVYRRVRG